MVTASPELIAAGIIGLAIFILNLWLRNKRLK
jgi:hypothetical protein